MKSSLIRIAIIGVLTLSLAGVAVADSALPDRVGVVVATRGDVVVYRDGAPASVLPGLELRIGDRLVARSGGHCTIYSVTGEYMDVKGPQELEFSQKPKGAADRLAAWIGQQLSQWLGEHNRRPLTTRSTTGDDSHAKEPRLPSGRVPAHGGRVRMSEPQVFWSPLPGVERYEVQILTENLEETRQTVRGHELLIHDLEPGERYAWTVAPIVEGWSLDTDWLEFDVMTLEEEELLDEALADTPNLRAGVVLLWSGLHGEAIHKLDAAAKHPATRDAALRWRSRACAEIGLYERAYNDLLQTTENE